MVLWTAQYIKHLKIHEALRLAGVRTRNGHELHLIYVRSNTVQTGRQTEICNFTLNHELKQKKEQKTVTIRTKVAF